MCDLGQWNEKKHTRSRDKSLTFNLFLELWVTHEMLQTMLQKLQSHAQRSDTSTSVYLRKKINETQSSEMQMRKTESTKKIKGYRFLKVEKVPFPQYTVMVVI